MLFLSKFFRRESILLAILTFIAVVFGLVRRDASKDRDRDAQIQELHDAQDIRDRVDRARRTHTGGVREFELAGWRDDDPEPEATADKD